MVKLKFIKSEKKRPSNFNAVRKAFNAGFNSGLEFLNEAEDVNGNKFRLSKFKEFLNSL